MGYSLQGILIVASLLLLLSVFVSKASQRIGVPALLAFLLIGMLAGSEGIGKIHFDNLVLAQQIGTVALAFILFSGAIETDWDAVKPILKDGILLSTVGVVLSAFFFACISYLLLNFSIRESLLIGAIVSSTDAAAVFMILKSHTITLTKKIKTLVEFESASNDPMAIILTLAILHSFVSDVDLYTLIADFLLQIVLAIIVAGVLGRFAIWFFRRVELDNVGLYHAFTVSIVFLGLGFTDYIGGSGFLAVYLIGLILARDNFAQKHLVINFHDGITWLMQITMFLTLGLLVYPTQLIQYFWIDLLLAFCLILIARPLSVFITLYFSKLKVREKIIISSLGFRGAVPIILATFPLLLDIPNDSQIFNLVFFIVLVSVLIQGLLIKRVLQFCLDKFSS